MRSPKAAKEDPAVVAAREREQRRAENARTEETQALLIGATQRRLRRFGSLKGSGGSVPIYGGARPPAGGGSTGGGGGFNFFNPIANSAFRETRNESLTDSAVLY